MTGPPWAEAAEQAVLGAILEAPRALTEARRTLAPGDFYRPAHQAVYIAACALADDDRPVNAVSVADELERRGQLARAGGHPYLLDLARAASPAGSVAYHADIVRRKADHRRAAEAVERAGQRLGKPDLDGSDLADVLDTMRGELDRITPASPAAPWRPVDLGPILRGEVQRPTPTVGLCRDDGLRTLYPGKEHAVIGETESGKSWYALACAAAELATGQHVVYVHFEESDPSDTVERLQALGTPDDAILDRFRFVAPDRPVTTDALRMLLDPVPSLVILDGTNEGMALHGDAIREEDGVAAFRRRLVNPCTAVGAAVLNCDHVVKDRDARGRYALGSIHKANALSGALLVLDNVEPFGRGQRGVSHVFVTKDRPGHLRRHGNPTRTSGKTYLGTLIVDDERAWKDYLDLAFVAPPEPSTDTGGATDPTAELDDHVHAVVGQITDGGQQATQNKVCSLSGRNRRATCDALERLVIAGRLTELTGSRGARVFVPARPVPCSGSKDPGTREQVAHLFREQVGTGRNNTSEGTPV